MDERKIWAKKKGNVYYVNEEFFCSWSSEMAYILGFFAADGCLTVNRKRGNKHIEFVSTDYEIIRKIKRTLKSEHKISSRKRGLNHQISYRLQVGSKKIYDDLISLGFMPNKSLILKFPDVPIKFLHHFVRGYFDGDGHCSFCKFKRKNRPDIGRVILSGFTSGSRKFLFELKNKLEKYANIIGGTFHFHGCYRLVYSTENSRKLYKFMYNNINQKIYLKRKYLTFQRAFKEYGLVA